MKTFKSISLLLAAESLLSCCWAFSVVRQHHTRTEATPAWQPLMMTKSKTSNEELPPQAWSCGVSTHADLREALVEAVERALEGLPNPPPNSSSQKVMIDLGLVSVSSLYDNNGEYSPATTVLETIVSTIEQQDGFELLNLIGSSVAGAIASVPVQNADEKSADKQQQNGESKTAQQTSSGVVPSLLECVELEGIPAVTVTLAVLPDVHVQTWKVESSADIPDPFQDPEQWRKEAGLLLDPATADNDDDDESSTSSSVAWVLPAPRMVPDLADVCQGLGRAYNNGIQICGGVSSTVSSLSRAKLYRYSRSAGVQECTTDGLVGVLLSGDIAAQTLRADGSKPVGGVYRIVQGIDSTIQLIVLDEDATAALGEEELDDDDDEDEDGDDSTLDKKEQMKKAYAKATMPKPVLAEANFLLRTLSDDDGAFMRKQLLVGLESTASPSTLTAADAAKAMAQRSTNPSQHPYTVHAVASGGMKDGSVTFALGSVQVKPGTRLRFFVRNSEFAAQQVDDVWLDYKRKALEAQFQPTSGDDEKPSPPSSFTPGVCFVVPTLDRGQSFFGKPHLESRAVARLLPTIPCISGFFSNGVIDSTNEPIVQGSASGYTLFGPQNPQRPIYVPQQQEPDELEKKEDDSDDDKTDATKSSASSSSRKPTATQQAAPRTDDNELILRRREVHSGRALTVSTVEWSVAEKTATPTSTLEEFMWLKETEVDRFRERVPLANLVSQCRVRATAEKSGEQRPPESWIRPVVQEAQTGFVVIPDCKRTDPCLNGSSLYRRYDLEKLVKEFSQGGAPAMSVNCDAIFFGGKLEDIEVAKDASIDASEDEDSTGVVPPILASDLILYPYQLYKLRLQGADAVNIMAGALEQKDMLYLTKIASSLSLETLITVTSRVQLAALQGLPSIDGVIVSNRNLEDFGHDTSGEQALMLLESDELKALKEKHPDLLVLAEGKLGALTGGGEDGTDDSTLASPQKQKEYLRRLHASGAQGGILGSGLSLDGMSLAKAQTMANNES